MNNYKIKQSFMLKLLLIISIFNSNCMILTMNSSVRKIAVPAMQSGIHVLTTQRVGSIPLTTPVSLNSSQGFESVYSTSSLTDLNLTGSVFKNISKSWLLPSLTTQSSSSSGSSGNAYNTAFLAGLTAVMFGSKVAYADNEEQADLEELFQRNDIDVALYPELVKFFNKYRCPYELEGRVKRTNFFKNLRSTKNENKHYDQYHGHILGSGYLFPGNSFEYFIKSLSIERIVNAERMKKVIKYNDLDCLKVVNKYLFYDQGQFSVVARKVIAGDQDKKISLKEIQQLVQLVKQTAYVDWQFGANVIRDIEDKLVFVDTENISYRMIGCRVHQSGDEVDLMSRLLLYNLDDDARAWLDSEVKCLKKENTFSYLRSLPNCSEFDSDIDFERVKKEYQKLIINEN